MANWPLNDPDGYGPWHPVQRMPLDYLGQPVQRTAVQVQTDGGRRVIGVCLGHERRFIDLRGADIDAVRMWRYRCRGDHIGGMLITVPANAEAHRGARQGASGGAGS